MAEHEIPRRIRMDRMHPVELAITNTIRAIEEMAADTRLTEAQTMLGQARDKVADYLDNVPIRLGTFADVAGEASSTTDPPPAPWTDEQRAALLKVWDVLEAQIAAAPLEKKIEVLWKLSMLHRADR